MNIYFAPLEGVTDVVYRRIHHSCFTGVDKYFMPFISPTQHLSFTNRELAAVSPDENAGICAVPQILTKNPEHFLWTANALHDVGYEEVNLNLGCPSGTVTAKGKGSGMLREPETLDRFLEEVFARAPLKISVKTRIGFESTEEWPTLLDIFAKYPIHELIVHPRTRREFYAGVPHRELCDRLLLYPDIPFVYNGDVFTPQDFLDLKARFPGASAIMIGRGLIANPALARIICGGSPLTREELRNFHDKLLDAFALRWPKNHLIGHMHEYMRSMLCCFEDSKRIRKSLRKSTTIESYLDTVDTLFSSCEMRSEPYYHTDD